MRSSSKVSGFMTTAEMETNRQPASADRSFAIEQLNVHVHRDAPALAAAAASMAAEQVQRALSEKQTAAIILATGQSQLAFLDLFLSQADIDWGRVTFFHMDEYLGLPPHHPASFQHYLQERVERRVQCHQFHYLEGQAAEPCTECDRYAALLQAQPIDLCMLGIGNNGHLAFNDPPVAHFHDPYPVKIVKLDPICRQQQVDQGHFPSIDAMPAFALTLSIPTLCDSRRLICIAQGEHKAEIVRTTLHGPISPACPASILRRQPHGELLLDADSARLLSH